VPVQEYRMALLDFIESEGRDLIEMFGASDLLRDLRARILGPDLGAGGKLTSRILQHTGARTPLALRAQDFNMGAEDVYRGQLSRSHLAEALEYLLKDCETVKNFGCLPGRFCHTGLSSLLGGRDMIEFVREAQSELKRTGELGGCRLVLTQLLLLVIGMHGENARITG
jgi:hypothetical protein